MNHETNEIDPHIPISYKGNGPDLKETVSWLLNMTLKVGAGYLVKLILNALRF